MKETAACAFEPSCCHFVLVIVSFFSCKKVICVSNWTFWSVRREHYTIGKSGLKHQERQNSQSWAHKLHWCGIIWSFACGASLPSPCAVLLLAHHLSYPELTSKCTVFSLVHFVILYVSFVLILSLCALCLVVCACLVFLVLTFCVSSLCSLAVFWIPKCSACSLEGEWWLTLWFDRFTIKQIWAAVLFCTPHTEAHVAEMLQTRWFSGVEPRFKYHAPCFVTYHREKMNIQDALCPHNICQELIPLAAWFLTNKSF